MTRPFFSSRGTVPVGAWALLLMLLCPLWEPCDIYYFPWHAGACCEWSQELGAEAAKESGWDSITARAGATWWLNGAALGNLEEHLFFSCFLHLYGLMALYNSWPLHPLRESGGYSFGGSLLQWTVEPGLSILLPTLLPEGFLAGAGLPGVATEPFSSWEDFQPLVVQSKYLADSSQCWSAGKG